MLGKLVLEQQRVASLTHHRARWMYKSRRPRWLLPGDHASAVDKGSRRVTVVARTLT